MHIATTIQKVPADWHWAQHKVHWALSVIDEGALANFFRAIRKGPVRPPLVDEVNAELDKGIGFQEMFKSSKDIGEVTGNDVIELQVMWAGWGDLHCWIRVGITEGHGPGAEWKVLFDLEGNVVELAVEEIWGVGTDMPELS